MSLIVYTKSGQEFFTLKEYSFSEALMGESKIVATAYSSDKLNFAVGHYVNYRNQQYSIFTRVVETKIARTGEGISNSMKYTLEFFSPAKILETINFDDYVSKDDTNQYYTGTSVFDFYNNVNELAIRLQANLDRFVGDGVWNVSVDASVVLEEKQVAVSNLNLMNGLNLVNSIFGLEYRINGTNIVIGGSGDEITTPFSYGKNNGLYEITRSVNNDTPVVTRMKVYGGNRNLPQDYLREEDAKGRYFTQLMLPNFAKTGIDYVDAPQEMIDEYGVREDSIVFDDIYPSIEEVVYGGNRIDEIASVEAIDPDSDYFVIYTHDLGFDINDYLTSKSPVLSIKGSNKDGSPSYLGGYEFEIVKVEGEKLTLLKNQSDNNILPDQVTRVRAGDRFVLLYIEMPYNYVTNAENKLLTRAQEYFQNDGDVEMAYTIKPDEKFITVNDLSSELIAGSRLNVVDADFNVDSYFTIQNIAIRQGKEILPTFDIKISNIKEKTLKEQINQVNIEQKAVNSRIINTASNKGVNTNLKTEAVANITVWQ